MYNRPAGKYTSLNMPTSATFWIWKLLNMPKLSQGDEGRGGGGTTPNPFTLSTG